jgi:hypothetical protein
MMTLFVIPGACRMAARGKGTQAGETGRTLKSLGSLPLALLAQGSAGNDRSVR